MKAEKQKYISVVFTLIAVLCGVIWAFTNLGYDCEYNMSMCFRFLNGDIMFLEMWEPHQSSVYLPAALMWIYMKICGTTTGIAVYLQICGILIRGGLSILLYRVLKDDLGQPVTYGMALLYFMVSPKDYAIPEFGNLQLWFSTLLFCCILTYFKTNRITYLILGAISLCLEVLAYPSCAIVLLGIIGILLLFSCPQEKGHLSVLGHLHCPGSTVGGIFCGDNRAAGLAGLPFWHAPARTLTYRDSNHKMDELWENLFGPDPGLPGSWQYRAYTLYVSPGTCRPEVGKPEEDMVLGIKLLHCFSGRFFCKHIEPGESLCL